MVSEILAGYVTAVERITDAGFGHEIDWAESLSSVKPTPELFCREAAWVILNSGFRASVARKVWPCYSAAFFDFRSAEKIARASIAVRARASACFKNGAKTQAIIDNARIVSKPEEWERTVYRLATEGPPSLQRFHFIGPVTCWHLAKLLGIDCVKPDLHLVRAAKAAEHGTPLRLCRGIQRETGERLTVIDSVLWRYGEQMKARGWPEWEELWKRG